ncbi:MAG: hypothetical protein QM535_15020 [Limnohabitans sp.]|nr:hypothetical protein [Limnohabitans sp.]
MLPLEEQRVFLFKATNVLMNMEVFDEESIKILLNKDSDISLIRLITKLYSFFHIMKLFSTQKSSTSSLSQMTITCNDLKTTLFQKINEEYRENVLMLENDQTTKNILNSERSEKLTFPINGKLVTIAKFLNIVNNLVNQTLPIMTSSGMKIIDGITGSMLPVVFFKEDGILIHPINIQIHKNVMNMNKLGLNMPTIGFTILNNNFVINKEDSLEVNIAKCLLKNLSCSWILRIENLKVKKGNNVIKIESDSSIVDLVAVRNVYFNSQQDKQKNFSLSINEESNSLTERFAYNYNFNQLIFGIETI